MRIGQHVLRRVVLLERDRLFYVSRPIQLPEEVEEVQESEQRFMVPSRQPHLRRRLILREEGFRQLEVGVAAVEAEAVVVITEADPGRISSRRLDGGRLPVGTKTLTPIWSRVWVMASSMQRSRLGSETLFKWRWRIRKGIATTTE